MKFSDELLMAYADGELDLVSRAEIETAMANDPAVARMIERHREMRARLQSAYGGVLAEPAPERLSSLIAPPVTAPVVDFTARRAAATVTAAATATAVATRRWQLPQWSAMAAAVALGLFVGIFMMRSPDAPYSESEEGLVARGQLTWALNGELASESGAGPVRMGVSFRNQGGGYCRTFRLQQEAPLAGLACRAGEEWKIQVLAAATPEEGELRGAASMPMAVLQAMDALIAGDPLDAPSEIAARDAGWQQ